MPHLAKPSTPFPSSSLTQLNSEVEKYIPIEYYHPFYTPMSWEVSSVLPILYDFLADDEAVSTTTAFYKQLKQCNMDFSLASLARLDKLLLAIRKQRPLQYQQLLDPKIEKFFAILTAYIGEVFSRARGQAALWFAADTLHEGLITKQNTDDISIYHMLVVLLSTDKQTLNLQNLSYFFPIFPLENMLFGDQSCSLHPYVKDSLQKLGDNIPEVTTKLPATCVYVDIDIKKEINQLASNERYYLQMFRPSWVDENPKDALYRQLQALKLLYTEGHVVWAAIVQANNALFEPDSRESSLPCEIVYDPTGRTNIQYLVELAGQLASLKNSEPQSADQQAHADRIKNERQRIIGGNYPTSLSRLPLKVSTMLVCRHHLPNRILAKEMFPILISEKCAGTVTILPSRFWHQHFVEAWLNLTKEHFGDDFNQMPNILRKEQEGIAIWANRNVVNPKLYQSVRLYPKLLDIFPHHIFPTETIRTKEQELTLQQQPQSERPPDIITLPQAGEEWIVIRSDKEGNQRVSFETVREDNHLNQHSHQVDQHSIHDDLFEQQMRQSINDLENAHRNSRLNSWMMLIAFLVAISLLSSFLK